MKNPIRSPALFDKEASTGQAIDEITGAAGVSSQNECDASVIDYVNEGFQRTANGY